jgi:hypothetical protein
LYRTSLWQIVFGPAGVLCMGSENNCSKHAPGFADGSLSGHRAVASQKSENFIDAAAAFGQGARKAKRHSLMMWPAPALAPDGEPSTASRAGKYPHRGGRRFRVVPDGGAGLQRSPAANWTGDAS